MNRTRKTATGFTLIELLVVVLIIGILAAIAVPAYFKIVEKGRFAEAITCVNVVKGAQERYFLKNNTYCGAASCLDVVCTASANFAAPALTGGATYSATLLRTPSAPAPYNGYTVTYVGPSGALTCSQTNCTTDLLPY